MNYFGKLKLKLSGKLKKCDCLMFANKETRDFLVGKRFSFYDIVSEIGISEKELIPENNGIRKHDNSKECVFLVVGRMIYRKGIDLLLDALNEIPENLKYEVRIVGVGSELEKYKTRCSSQKKLYQRVRFVGDIPHSEISKEYENADVLIMPSLRETTGTVILEAFANGVPVITINKFGGANIVDQESGWLYEGDDKKFYIENLKKAIVQCIMHPSEVKRKGENARKKAEKYTWNVKNSNYQEIYKRLFINLDKK